MILILFLWLFNLNCFLLPIKAVNEMSAPPIAQYSWPSRKKLIVYHASWRTYSNFNVKDIPIDNISDINYAFYKLQQDPQSGFYVPVTRDPWADHDKRFTDVSEGVLPLDSWNDQGTKFGNFNQFMKLKNQGKMFNFG